MPPSQPHFLLFSDATGDSTSSERWRFVLESLTGGHRIVAADVEPGSDASRLALLAVVRGLEALDGPSEVTLVTSSRYVGRGINRGLNQWRERGWHWERFGRLVPIRDHDLWRRVDRALRYHHVTCRVWQSDPRESPSFASSPWKHGRRARVLDELGDGTTTEGHRRRPKTVSHAGRRRNQPTPRPETSSRQDFDPPLDGPRRLLDWPVVGLRYVRSIFRLEWAGA